MRSRLFFICLLLAFTASTAAAQRRTITGRVTDETTRSPISGAQIVIRGTNTGTLGKADGTFVLQVPAGEVTLQVSFIGYKRAEVRVAGDQANVQIPMRVDVLQVDEIVVTGQATGMQRRNLANAVAKVNAAELVRAAPAATRGATALLSRSSFVFAGDPAVCAPTRVMVNPSTHHPATTRRRHLCIRISSYGVAQARARGEA